VGPRQRLVVAEEPPSELALVEQLGRLFEEVRQEQGLASADMPMNQRLLRRRRKLAE
jgi:hypothetical protein